MKLELDPDAPEAWGWRGRTLGLRILTRHNRAWLRLACIPADQEDTFFFDGPAEADTAMPASIPRPRLLRWHEWQQKQHRYRAELYRYVDEPPIAAEPIPTAPTGFTTAWWSDVRTALADLAEIHTTRFAVHQNFLDAAMPRILGEPIDTHAPEAWATAHGDFHLANLTGPQLYILDFEGWGLAPRGYDAATLHSYSLLVPSVAATIRSELAPLLETAGGRYAELVTITEMLHGIRDGEDLALATALRERASSILQRPVPQVVKLCGPGLSGS